MRRHGLTVLVQRQSSPPSGAAVTAPADTQLPQGCHRSHPHENMDAQCERLTVIARENNRRANEQAENELIMIWLGWRKHPDPELHGWWAPPGKNAFMSHIHAEFPTFTTWHDCGLILEALRANDLMATVVVLPDDTTCYAHIGLGEKSHAATGPLAIRSAALSYLRSLER